MGVLNEEMKKKCESNCSGKMREKYFVMCNGKSFLLLFSLPLYF
jgi:hypothetical protein